MTVKVIPNYLSVSEAAKKLGVPPYKVQREIKRGNLSAIRIGWQYAISTKALRKYVRENK